MTNSSSSSNNAAMQQNSNANSQKGCASPSMLTGNWSAPSPIIPAKEIQERINQATRAMMEHQINPPVFYPSTVASTAAQYGPKRHTSTDITINEVENGRLVTVNGKTYICPQGTPLLEIIGQALVEAQLEK